MQASALLLRWGSYRRARNLRVLNCLFIFSPCYVVLCASKARHGFGSEKVSWCLAQGRVQRAGIKPPNVFGTLPQSWHPPPLVTAYRSRQVTRLRVAAVARTRPPSTWPWRSLLCGRVWWGHHQTVLESAAAGLKWMPRFIGASLFSLDAPGEQ